MASAGATLVVPNSGSNSVSLIDAATGTLTATVPVGIRPTTPVAGVGTQFQSYLDRVYVPNQGSDTVSVVDTRKATVIATVTVGGSPGEPATSPPLSGSDVVYVPNLNSSTTTVFRENDGTVLGQIATQAGPVQPSPNVDGSLVFIPNSQAGTVSVFDEAKQEVIRTLRIGRSPGPGAKSPDGRTIYIPNQGGTTVGVIDATRGTLAAIVRVGPHPSTPAVAGTKLFVSNAQGTVTVVDASSRIWPTAPWPVRAAAAGKGAVALKWRAPADSGVGPVLHYNVFASTGQTCVTTHLSCVIRGLPSGQRVIFEVRAVNRSAAGNAAMSRAALVR